MLRKEAAPPQREDGQTQPFKYKSSENPTLTRSTPILSLSYMPPTKTLQMIMLLVLSMVHKWIMKVIFSASCGKCRQPQDTVGPVRLWHKRSGCSGSAGLTLKTVLLEFPCGHDIRSLRSWAFHIHLYLLPGSYALPSRVCLVVEPRTSLGASFFHCEHLL